MEEAYVADFYRNRSVFLTGGTGFMGKVLIEKLLRSCPDMDTIYLLVRPKSGCQASQRIQELVDCKVSGLKRAPSAQDHVFRPPDFALIRRPIYHIFFFHIEIVHFGWQLLNGFVQTLMHLPVFIKTRLMQIISIHSNSKFE